MKNLFKKNQLMITALAVMIAIAGYLQFAGTSLEEEYLNTNGENISSVNSDGVITENLTAGSLESYNLDGTLEISAEDLALAGLEDINSLDSDVDIIVEDYLDVDMQTVNEAKLPAGDTQVADSGADLSQLAEAQPDEDEIPGEAVFTSANGITILSEAKLLKEQTRAKNKETLLDIINSTGITDEQKQEAVNTMVEMTAIAEKEAAAEILLEAKGFDGVVVSINGDAVDVVVNAANLSDIMRAQIEDIVVRKTELPAQNIIISTVVQ